MAYRKNSHSIDFFKFVFCCVIFLMHYRTHFKLVGIPGYFCGGYLAVEFFFIVSGFLMMSKIERGSITGESAEKLAFGYLVKRYKQLYPLYLISVVFFVLTINFFVFPWNLKTIVLDAFPDFFALQIFWRPMDIGTHFWYVSALLWASFLVYYLVLKNRDLFIYIIEPIALLSFIAVTFRVYGHLDLTSSEDLWVSGIRAFVEIGLGCCLYVIYSQIKDRNSILSPWIYTALEVILFSVIIVIMYRTREESTDFAMIFLLAAFILLVFLKRGYVSILLDNRISAFLGSISYLVFLNHPTIIYLTRNLFPSLGFYRSSVIRIIIIIAVCGLELAVYNKLKAKVKKLCTAEALNR